MLGVKHENRGISLRSNESRFDAEHWVGKYPSPLRRVRKVLLMRVVGLTANDNDQRRSSEDEL